MPQDMTLNVNGVARTVSVEPGTCANRSTVKTGL
jgi:hypothetical protein